MAKDVKKIRLDSQHPDREKRITLRKGSDSVLKFFLSNGGKLVDTLAGCTGQLYLKHGSSPYVLIESTDIESIEGSITFEVTAATLDTAQSYSFQLAIESSDESEKHTFGFGKIEVKPSLF